MDKYAGKIAKNLYLKPGIYLKKVFYFSKQYGNPKTRLLKLDLD